LAIGVARERLQVCH